MITGKKILSLLLSVIMALGMCTSAMIAASAMLDDSYYFFALSDPLPTGTTKYFLAYCTPSSQAAPQIKYLKVVKDDSQDNSQGELTVYEADSLALAVSAAGASGNISGSWFYSEMGSSGDEEWTISVSEGTGYNDIFISQELSSIAWSFYDLPQPLDTGTTRWFKVSIVDSNDTVSDKFLKVAKNNNALTVYEADSFAETGSAFSVSTNLIGNCQSSFSSWSNSYNEYWILSVNGTSYSAISDLRELSSAGREFANLTAALPAGTAEYFTVNCCDGNFCFEKFLKVVKTGADALCVYEADSFADAVSASAVSMNLVCSTAFNYGTSIWDESTQEWITSYTETWTVSIPYGAGYIAIDDLRSVFNDDVNVTIDDGIGVNFYLDFDDPARVCDGVDSVAVTYKDFGGETVTDTHPKSALPVADGKYKLTVRIAPAQLADEITVNVGEIEYRQSVLDYCNDLMDDSANAAYFPFLSALEQYWQAACIAFDYPVDPGLFAAGDSPEPAEGFNEWDNRLSASPDMIGKIGSISFLALTKPEFRFYTPRITEPDAAHCKVTASFKDGGEAGRLKARFAKDAQKKVLVEVTGVKPEDLGRTIVVTIEGLGEDDTTTEQIEFAGYDFAKVMTETGNTDLGVALYNYGAAAAGLVEAGIWE